MRDGESITRAPTSGSLAGSRSTKRPPTDSAGPTPLSRRAGRNRASESPCCRSPYQEKSIVRFAKEASQTSRNFFRFFGHKSRPPENGCAPSTTGSGRHAGLPRRGHPRPLCMRAGVRAQLPVHRSPGVAAAWNPPCGAGRGWYNSCQYGERRFGRDPRNVPCLTPGSATIGGRKGCCHAGRAPVGPCRPVRGKVSL